MQGAARLRPVILKWPSSDFEGLGHKEQKIAKDTFDPAPTSYLDAVLENEEQAGQVNNNAVEETK